MASRPNAVKIVDITKGLSLDSAAVRNILLREEIREKPVCVISIAGAFRQGKSFLLNFFVRYLTITCKEKRDVVNWLRPEDGPVIGFTWRGGSKTVTSGILMWSEIFIVERPNGEEVAVVLLDTQGSFDNETTMKGCASIFALSTLVSSVQIYNLKDNIKSSDLDHLRFFLGYGKLLRDVGNEKPFQKLMFLIRDWCNSEEFPYGSVGGNYLLQKILDTHDQNVCEELISLRQGIKELFEEIHCYLLPHPGINVTKLNFSGELKDIDTDFKEFVEMLAVTVLAPQNLNPKIINGESLKVKNLVGLFESYCQQFVGKNMPKVESIYFATAKAQYIAVIEEAEEVYDQIMTPFVQQPVEEQVLLEKHRATKSIALNFFNDKKIIGDREMRIKGSIKLENLLDRKFKEYEYLNRIKLEKDHIMEIQRMFEEQKSKMTDLEEQIRVEREMNQMINEMKEKLANLQRLLDQEKRQNAQWREKSNKSTCTIL